MSRSTFVESHGPIPHNPDLERAILGAILVQSGSLSVVENILIETDFFVTAHRKIFSAMRRLAASGQPVELLSVCDILNGDPDLAAAGGAAYIAKLPDGLHRSAPVAHWARTVRNHSVLRSVAHASEFLMQSALEPSAKAEEVVAHLQAIGKMYAGAQTGSHPPLSAVAAEELLARDIKPRQCSLIRSFRSKA